MDAAHIDGLRKKARVLRDQRIEAAKQEYKATVNSIDLVARLERTKTNIPTSGNSKRSVSTRNGSLADTVSRILPELQSPFTTEHVLEALKTCETPPSKEPHKATISNVLKRFIQSGVVVVTKEAAGRRSGEFEYVSKRNGSIKTNEGPRVNAAPVVGLH